MIDLTKQEFKISIVAMMFFDNTPKWLRYHEVRFIDDEGNPLGRRADNNRGGDRLYTLSDIREMAYILRRRGIISSWGLMHCLERLDSMEKPVYKRNPRMSKMKEEE